MVLKQAVGHGLDGHEGHVVAQAHLGVGTALHVAQQGVEGVGDPVGEAINANYRRELFPQAGDKVLTLSTCYRQNRMQRFLVQGVLAETYDVIK